LAQRRCWSDTKLLSHQMDLLELVELVVVEFELELEIESQFVVVVAEELVVGIREDSWDRHRDSSYHQESGIVAVADIHHRMVGKELVVVVAVVVVPLF